MPKQRPEQVKAMPKQRQERGKAGTGEAMPGRRQGWGRIYGSENECIFFLVLSFLICSFQPEFLSKLSRYIFRKN
jgi:hypothetical protein